MRVTIKPDDAVAAIAARSRPVCCAERESQTDLAVLSSVCARHNLPRPERRLMIGEKRADRAYFEMMRRPRLFTTNAARAPRSDVLVEYRCGTSAIRRRSGSGRDFLGSGTIRR